MSATTGRLRSASAILPLAVLSTAWTLSLAGVGAGSASADEGSGTLPDGTVLPTAAIEAPASIGDAVTRAAAMSPDSVNEIPQVALSAYQRAEAVINSADRTCHLPWELVAAIGRVESDHGRFEGNALNAEGVAEPGIYGIALDGTRGTQNIPDTDAGEYDKDTAHDRAVGPMQFIPSTWSVVGVDGDSDGIRDPQDIDDAALATAVYLCSGEDDLSTEQGQRASVYRYNHSNDYVDLVLEIMQSYMDGDFTAVTSTSLPSYTPPTTNNNGGKGKKDDKDKDKPTKKPTPTQTPSPTKTPTPTATPTQSPTNTPTSSPTKNPPTSIPTSLPTTLPTVLPTTLPTTLPTVLPTLLTLAEAQTQCLASGISALDTTALNNCIADLTTP